MKKLAPKICLLTLCFLGVLSAYGASSFTENNTEKISMGPFGEKKEYIISPPFEGYLLENGKPLANTTIIRSISYNTIGDKWENESFQTNDKGYFKIPEKILNMRLSFLSQFVGATKLYVLNGGKEEKFWYSHTTDSENKNIYDQFISDKPIGFTCDLRNEELIQSKTFSGFITKCRWDNFPDNESNKGFKK